MIVDAHMHIWNKLHGSIGGKIPLVGLGNGMIRIGENAMLGMPASHADCTARAEWVVAEFDAAGVDTGVVVQENMDGEQNDYCLRTMREFPGRFFCHALPDYFSPQSFVQQCSALFAKGFGGIKVPGGHLAMANVAVDHKSFMPVWERMAAEGHVMAIDMSEGDGQVPPMENILRHFPNLKVAIGHFGMPTRRGWPGQLRLCRHENVYMESGGIIWLYRNDGYPFPNAMKAINEAKKEVGIEKLMWGSDWPRTMVDFTYRQSLDFVRKSDALSDDEKTALLGANAAKLYGLTTPSQVRKPVALITEG
jgi:predicted TIM-barrel fold metal-dependent hydrolase